MDEYHDKYGNVYTRVVEVDPATQEPVAYEYLVRNRDGKDQITVFFETEAEGDAKAEIEQNLTSIFRGKIGVTPIARGVAVGELPRSEKKTKRIFDNRY